MGSAGKIGVRRLAKEQLKPKTRSPSSDGGAVPGTPSDQSSAKVENNKPGVITAKRPSVAGARSIQKAPLVRVKPDKSSTSSGTKKEGRRGIRLRVSDSDGFEP